MQNNSIFNELHCTAAFKIKSVKNVDIPYKTAAAQYLYFNDCCS